MSATDKKALSRQYRQLPRVDSPIHLDQKILQEARNGVPEPRKDSSSRWIPALAAACMAGVVFYIAAPQYEPQSYLPAESDLSGSAASLEEEVSLSDFADSADDVVQPRPEAASQVPESRQVELKRKATDDRPDKKSIVSKDTRNVVESAREQSSDLQNSFAGIAASPAQDASLEKELKQDGFPKNQRLRANTARKPIVLSADEIEARLQRIRALADKALLEEAQRLLDQLIASCPECELPSTLAVLQRSDQIMIDQKQEDKNQTDAASSDNQ